MVVKPHAVKRLSVYFGDQALERPRKIILAYFECRTALRIIRYRYHTGRTHPKLRKQSLNAYRLFRAFTVYRYEGSHAGGDWLN